MTAAAYYNEFDTYAAAWLRNLIAAGHIPAGEVDTRSIEDVRPDDLIGFNQCHFFAGIGVWPLALRRAGWADDRPVWTGSCPCQPFSAAGKGLGFADERHLWPAWGHLIKIRKPAVVFGEQVASKAVDAWIDLVHADLEAMGYAFGGIAFPSSGVGAPHIRDRTYWVADAYDKGLEGWGGMPKRSIERTARARRMVGGLADTDGRNASAERQQRGGKQRQQQENGFGAEWLADTESQRRGRWAADTQKSAGRRGIEDDGSFNGERPSPTNGLWRDADWLGCTDGKWRPVEPGTFPLVAGSAGGVGRVRANQERIAALPRKDQGSRQGRLKGYGNAVNAMAAQAWIETVMETI